MGDIQFEIKWESAHGARGPELRATWASLRIVVRGHVVTQLLDVTSTSVRDAVCGPLYPIAEWIVSNWWALLYEIDAPAQPRDHFLRRHSLADAAEGFALPVLVFSPTGPRIELSWALSDNASARTRFLSQGREAFDRGEVEGALCDFVNEVTRQLEREGCGGTFLAEEWAAIRSADPDERQFCAFAGRLGLDPYALSASMSGGIIRAAEGLPPSFREEFFVCASDKRLAKQAALARKFLDSTRNDQSRLEPLKNLRARLPTTQSQKTPWEEGYGYARWLRETVGAKGALAGSRADIASVFNLDPLEWRRSIKFWPRLDFADALMAVNSAGAPQFVVARTQRQDLGFTVCRALFEYLYEGNSESAVVSPAHSDRQKRNRAFAAEFIVPSSELERRIVERHPTRVVTPLAVYEIAKEFGASEMVVRHQIENHDLAKVVDW